MRFSRSVTMFVAVLGIALIFERTGLTRTAQAKPPQTTYRIAVEDPDGVVVASGTRTARLLNSDDNFPGAPFNEDGPLYLNDVIDFGGVADYVACFGSSGASDPGGGSYQRDRQDPNQINMTFSFPGKDTNGKEISYRLDFTGQLAQDETTWTPSAPGEFATIVLGTWELKPAKKGERNGCSGTGSFKAGSKIIVTILSAE